MSSANPRPTDKELAALLRRACRSRDHEGRHCAEHGYGLGHKPCLPCAAADAIDAAPPQKPEAYLVYDVNGLYDRCEAVSDYRSDTATPRHELAQRQAEIRASQISGRFIAVFAAAPAPEGR